MLAKVSGQFVLKSIRTQVNSYSFWSIHTQKFGQFVLMVWSIRTHIGRFVLILVNSYSCLNEYELTKMSIIIIIIIIIIITIIMTLFKEETSPIFPEVLCEYELTKIISRVA